MKAQIVHHGIRLSRRGLIKQGVKFDEKGRAILRDLPEDIVIVNGKPCWRIGTILDEPDTYQLCIQGVAEPVDDECKAACGDHNVKEAQRVYPAFAAGIAPEHYEFYLADKMTGYDDDGEIVKTKLWTEADDELLNADGTDDTEEIEEEED